MSKYYKAKDIINAILVLNKKVFLEKRTTEPILKAIRDLPTIEVSEDCISREWVLDKLNEQYKVNRFEEHNDTANIGINQAESIIEDAPSVVPKPKEGECTQTTLCRECDDYAGDGMYCASNYLAYDFSTSRENCEAPQVSIDKAKADIAEWSSWSKTYEAMCGAKTKGADDE